MTEVDKHFTYELNKKEKVSFTWIYHKLLVLYRKIGNIEKANYYSTLSEGCYGLNILKDSDVIK